jgi:sugar/nucleoside kinase (ribokinase family)
VERAADILIGCGVRRTVVIHFPEAVFARTRTGAGYWQPSLQMPADRIRGAAGAGDALAAGVLYGIHEGWPLRRSLLLGVSAAASSLTHPSCSAGIVRAEDCFALAREVGLRKAPR